MLLIVASIQDASDEDVEVTHASADDGNSYQHYFGHGYQDPAKSNRDLIGPCSAIRERFVEGSLTKIPEPTAAMAPTSSKRVSGKSSFMEACGHLPLGDDVPPEASNFGIIRRRKMIRIACD